MRRYEDVVIGSTGVGQSGCSITVKRRPDGLVMQLYGDAGGTVLKDNPVFTDELGRFWFYVSDGRYDLEVSGPNIQTFTLEDVFISESGGGGGGGGIVVGTLGLQNADSVNIVGGTLKNVIINDQAPGTMLGQNANAVAISGGQVHNVQLISNDVNITGGTINGVDVALIGAGGGGGGGTMSTQDADDVAIVGGTIDGVDLSNVSLSNVTLTDVVLVDNVVITLLANLTVPATGASKRVNQSQNRSFQATLVGTGTGPISCEVVIEVSQDENAWLELATIDLFGNAPGPLTDGFATFAPWSFVRGRLTSLSGAGASLNLTMGD